MLYRENIRNKGMKEERSENFHMKLDFSFVLSARMFELQLEQNNAQTICVAVLP